MFGGQRVNSLAGPEGLSRGIIEGRSAGVRAGAMYALLIFVFLGSSIIPGT